MKKYFCALCGRGLPHPSPWVPVWPISIAFLHFPLKMFGPDKTLARIYSACKDARNDIMLVMTTSSGIAQQVHTFLFSVCDLKDLYLYSFDKQRSLPSIQCSTANWQQSVHFLKCLPTVSYINTGSNFDPFEVECMYSWPWLTLPLITGSPLMPPKPGSMLLPISACN